MALAGETARLIVALQLDDKGFTGKLNAAGKALSRMDSGLSQMGRGAGQVAGGLGRLGAIAGAAAAGGLAAVVTTAASFEQAFTGVEKTVDGTDKQLAKLEETLRGMARTMPVSFEELAAIGEAGGALGIARESLDEFVDVVARLAVSTNLSSDQAATALGQLGNVLKLSGSDFEDFADSLVALGNAGASTEDQIVEMAARFGAAGNSAGLSKEEILGLSSAVASMGIEVEAGGSSLSRLFNNTTTNIGVANEKAEAFADALGLTFDEFKRAWDRDALGTFQDLLRHLNDLDQFEAASLLKSIGITNTRDINSIKLMSQNMGFVNDQLKIAENAQGALGKESEKFFSTTQAQWKVLVNNVRDVAAVLGTELLPIVNDVMKDFVEFLAQPGTQAGLKDFAKDLAAGVKDLATELKGTDFSGIVGGLKIAAEVAKGAFDAFRALPQPIQQLAIAALVANKVSGGAIGQIAAGLGNLVLGSLKTITATHVTVVGGTVTGGPGGGTPPVGGGRLGGGGFLGGLAGGLAVAGGAALAGQATVMGVEFVQNGAKQIEGIQTSLDNLPRKSSDELYDSLDKIRAASAEANKDIVSSVISTKTGLNARLDAAASGIRGEIHTFNMSEGNRATQFRTVQQAAVNATHRLNANEGTRAATAHARLSGIRDQQATSNATLAQIRNKRSSVNVTANVNTTVVLSAAQANQQLQSLRQTVEGGGFI